MHLLPVHPTEQPQQPLLEDIPRPQVPAIQAPMVEAVKEEMAVVRTIIEARKEASDVRRPRVIPDEITTAIPPQFRRIMAPHHKVHLQVIVQQLALQDTEPPLLRRPPQTTQLRPLMATPPLALPATAPPITVMICLPTAAKNNHYYVITTTLTTTTEIHIVLLSIVRRSTFLSW